MFIEELFNPEPEFNYNEHYLENLCNILNDRLYLEDVDLSRYELNDYELYYKLNNAIEMDTMSISSNLKYYLKQAILKFCIKINSDNLSEDERNELKWFLVERLQGYMPCSHRLLYNI